MSEYLNDPELAAFEARLGSLEIAPPPTALDRRVELALIAATAQRRAALWRNLNFATAAALLLLIPALHLGILRPLTPANTVAHTSASANTVAHTPATSPAPVKNHTTPQPEAAPVFVTTTPQDQQQISLGDAADLGDGHMIAPLIKRYKVQRVAYCADRQPVVLTEQRCKLTLIYAHTSLEQIVAGSDVQ